MKKKTNISSVLKNYINETHQKTYSTAQELEKKIDEPGHISQFLEGHKELEDRLNNCPLPSHYIIDIVFTHQTPKIKLVNGDISVEIADLLLVYIPHNKRDSKLEGKALLIQAKRNQKPKTGSLAGRTESVQFEIYNHWHPFNFITRKDTFSSNNTSWHFQLDKQNELSNYTVIYAKNAFGDGLNNPSEEFINNDFFNDCSWNAAKCEHVQNTASQGLLCDEDFSELFEKVITGQAGKKFSPDLAEKNDHWSLFVIDMMQLASDPSYKYKLSRQGIKESSRHATMSSFLATESVASVLKQTLNYPTNKTNLPLQMMDFHLVSQIIEQYCLTPKITTPPIPPDFSFDDAPEVPPTFPPMMIIRSFDKESYKL